MENALLAACPRWNTPGGLQVVPRIRELRKKSEYILGWIAMEGMEEPVVRKDNTFFLTHDALGRRNSNGAIFMDERTSLLTRVPIGETVEVLKPGPRWTKVKYGARTGYMMTEFLAAKRG